MPAAANVDANAMNLAQYLTISNEPIVRAVGFSLIDNGSIMARDIPFVNKATLHANGVRWVGNLPTVDWVPLNTEGAVIGGAPTPFQEQAYIVRNNIDVDKFLVADENQIVDPRAARMEAYTKALAYDFNDKFINNSHITGEINAPAGLRFRLDNVADYQIPSANKIAGALGADTDITMTTAVSAANMNVFLETLDMALWSVGSPEGDGVVVYMNEVLLRRIHTAIRTMGTTGGFATDKDMFDRVITRYKGAELRDVGYKADQTTRIITTTEATTGLDSSSTYTSLYVVNYGMDALFGWQMAPMSVTDQGLTEGGAIYRINVDWAGGLYQAGHRSIARVYRIKLA